MKGKKTTMKEANVSRGFHNFKNRRNEDDDDEEEDDDDDDDGDDED